MQHTGGDEDSNAARTQNTLRLQPVEHGHRYYLSPEHLASGAGLLNPIYG